MQDGGFGAWGSVFRGSWSRILPELGTYTGSIFSNQVATTVTGVLQDVKPSP